MIYFILKPFIRIALKIFCPDLKISDQNIRNIEGPVLITANHPNSFLDAIIIASIFKHPIHFLARGDVFIKPRHNYLLRCLHMFPVYRLSEGKENLSLNSNAFENSKSILSKNGIVLIFIEGICVHKHELQPFKKGAARIAVDCWKQNIPLKILPLGISYHSINHFGKSVKIQTALPLTKNNLMLHREEAKNYLNFNQILFEKINKLIQIPQPQRNKLPMVFIFGWIGKILHQPLYRLLANIVRTKTRGTVFYDSVLFGLLFFSYPIYLFFITIILCCLQIPGIWIFILIGAHPLLAYLATAAKMRASDSLDA
ncbi:MAG: 1-acyl-sn-glycerol-3-phosphate acyltransferase [Chitinophagaceae bacterium]|nr:1-acyl-sn-glycerol-3-phosphate acyltransferase [Chitinophagaceae bacterium]